MIEVDNLKKDFGTIRAVRGVTFQVEKGDILGFLGPNGAGKSTTMKMVTGFLPPTGGCAHIGGHDIQKNPIDAKKLIGYLPENSPLYQEMTVFEFLSFIAELREMRSREERTTKIGRVMEICHLGGVRNQPIETLSKGFRQRVGLAQAVIHDPPCLVLDEPTDGLDPNQKQEVRRLIASMAEEKAIVLSTHILEEVEAMCTRIIIIAKGEILVDETPEALRRRHPRYNALRITLRNGETAQMQEHFSSLPQISEVIAEEHRLTLIPRDGNKIDDLIFEASRDHGWPIQSLEKAPIRLEEVFWDLTQKTASLT